MADNDDDIPLPPKLDLRKKGLVKPTEPSAAEAPESKPAPDAPKSAPAPEAPQAESDAQDETVTKATAPAPAPAAERARSGPLRPKIAQPRKPSDLTGAGTEGGAQPTVRVAKPGDAAGAAASQPKTIRISIPSAAGKSEPAEAPAQDAAAQSTEAPNVAAPQPTAKPATVRVTRPGGEGGQPKAVTPSPIPLDKLSGGGKGDEPKTIRLKRPSEGFTSAKTVASAPGGGEENAEVEDDSEQPTRKKTIKVKRPDRSDRRAKPMTIARSGEAPKRPAGAVSGAASGATHAAGAGGGPAGPEREGAGGVVATICAFAAVCVCGVVVYLFVAQGHPEWGIPTPENMIVE